MISIIIPLYNAEKYLNRCIKSVIDQSYSDLEILLVDDGSTDRSLQLCRKWERQDSRIKVIVQSNQGVSAARNAGLVNATGSYIMFLDSDDYMKPDMCTVMLDKMQEKEADLLICGIEENNGHYWRPNHNADYLTLDALKFDFIQLLHTELLSPSWNKIYKKEKIKTGFFDGISFGEDLIFNLNYLKNCQRISFITNTLYFHEKENENSVARNIDAYRLNNIEALQTSILDFYGKKDNVLIYEKYIKDIVRYVKKLLTSKTVKYKDKISLLEKWRHDSYISLKQIKCIPISWKNKMFVFFLQKRLWILAYSIVWFQRKTNKHKY